MKHLFRYVLAGFLAGSSTMLFAQSYNNDPAKSYINHTLPKSPESSSFEKYGKIPVGELTGTASIKVPLFNVTSKGLSVPIELSYHASGIRVNQEATWVGLGWDLVPGGRITLDIKGGYDGYSDQFLNSSYKSLITYVQGFPSTPNLNAVNGWGILPCTYGTSGCTIPTGLGFDPSDYAIMVKNIAKYGMAEPDIYNVSCMGLNFSFYKDLFTGEIKLIGDHNIYYISETSAGFGISDDQGNTYWFEQEEKTHFSTPISGFFSSLTTAWLITKITDADGEEITYTYNNYGAQFSAPAVSESETTYLDGLNDNSTNIDDVNQLTYTESQYLSKIESKNTRIDFQFGYRQDIGGAGARKLERIKVVRKSTSEVIRKIQFNYDYFTGAVGTGDGHYFNTSLLSHSSPSGSTTSDQLLKRLKLVSLNIFGPDSTLAGQLYRFVYDATVFPSKVSLAQDHWGYYNGAQNNPGTGLGLFLPSINLLVSEGILASASLGNVRSGISTITPNITSAMSGHADRRANAAYAQAGMLKAVIYPTGGWTNFDYELHHSYFSPSAPDLVGGGLRIKHITNFSSANNVESNIGYEYTDNLGVSSGTYNGALTYIKADNNYSYYEISGTYTYGWQPSITLFSNGNLGGGVNYTSVIKRMIDYTNTTNTGYEVKNYKTGPVRDVFTSGSYPVIEGGHYLPLTPDRYLDGQLMSTQTFNSAGQMVQSVTNYYSQINKLDALYNLRVALRDMKRLPTGASFNPDLNSYFSFYYDPARSYYTQLDSTVTVNFEPGTSSTSKGYFTYNTYNQREYAKYTRSDGSATIHYTKTALTYSGLPQVPTTSGLSGNALGIQHLRMKRLYDTPIEAISILKRANGDELVTHGVYNIYDEDANLKEVYQLENLRAIPVGSFTQSALVSSDIAYDSRYKLKQSASYYASGFIKQLTDAQKVSSFIVDPVNDQILAGAKNAAHANIAYTSFETAETGNWRSPAGH